jgi:hypothetical protein
MSPSTGSFGWKKTSFHEIAPQVALTFFPMNLFLRGRPGVFPVRRFLGDTTDVLLPTAQHGSRLKPVPWYLVAHLIPLGTSLAQPGGR